MTPHEQPLDLGHVRERLAAARGPEYWRTLDELAQTEGFQELLEREYPGQAGTWLDPVHRRQFLKLMGASLALAGLTGCAAAPVQKIVPYVRQPEEIVPGKPLFFATAMPLAGYGTGVLVENHMGRPTKVEGNPDHPASLGATDPFAQASVLTLYDPDRSQAVINLAEISAWDTFVAEMGRGLRGKKDLRLRVLTETVTSPSLAYQLQELLPKKVPGARWHVYEPAGRDNARAGADLAFPEPVDVQYRFDRAKRILSFDSDFLSCGPGHVRFVHDFSDVRRVRQERLKGKDKDRARVLNRLYAVESTPTNTGAKADHRLPLRASQVEVFARAVAAEVRNRLGEDAGQGALQGLAVGSVPGEWRAWIRPMVADLVGFRKQGLVIAGDGQPAVVHAIAHALNQALDNVGDKKPVYYTKRVEVRPKGSENSFAQLVKDMAAGRVDILLILGGNPVYTAPTDLDFAGALEKVNLGIHLSLYHDETSELCQWHIPEAHYLEAWGDVRSRDGWVSIIQPLIAPLYAGSKTAQEVLAVFTGQPEHTSYELVRSFWKDHGFGALQGGNFEAEWRRSLHNGLVEKTNAETVGNLSVKAAWPKPSQPGKGLEIIFRPDPTLFDGRFANNGWLQELPKPLTMLTWDNAALLSPATAARHGLANKTGPHGGPHGELYADVIELSYRGRTVRAPAFILAGHPDDAITVNLGHGRKRTGKVGTGVGFSAYALRTAAAPWFDTGLEIKKVGGRHSLACTQHHHLMNGRDLVRSGPVQDYPHVGPGNHNGRKELPTLYPDDHKYEGLKWAMVIDVNACTGCSACVVACQAENNIPVVGKEQVLRAREMHWLRIDTYHKGDADNPETYFQPLPCMHCENAPCELVCPVAATAHSSEGLNDMVYNRCVGTRYCSNNCPYKVRRFNFFQYADYATESLKLLRNPEVTVRTRGVMEKCTYCVQRITRARIEAEKEDRWVKDGEVQTACQAACPAGAIVFGDLNERGGPSAVAKLQKEPTHYGLLTELNTRPRTTYLAALRNPNPNMPGAGR